MPQDQLAFQQMQRDIADIKAQLANPHVDLDTDISGLFQTVSVPPTTIPQSPYDQVQIYSNGSTYRLYIYDGVNRAWHYATLT